MARRLPKYGNDIDEVDAYAARLGEIFAREAQQYTPWRGGVFGTSLRTYRQRPGGRGLWVPLQMGETHMRHSQTTSLPMPERISTVLPPR